MNRATRTALVVGSSVVLALTFCMPARAQAGAPMNSQSMSQSPMMDDCQAMQAQKQKLTEDAAAQSAELTALVTAMNRAPNDTKKIGLMANIVTKMVEQQTAMNERRAQMQEQMMQHMAGQMQMGMGSMSPCPMMKGMKGMKGMKDMRGMNGMAGMDDAPKSSQLQRPDGQH
jgi:hypothetical protein